MLKKILSMCKTTILVWGCILVPLFIGAKFIKSASRRDAQRCIDTFIHTEGVGLSKYMALQFENTFKQLQRIMAAFPHEKDAKLQEKALKSSAALDDNIVSVVAYDGEKGKFLASSLEKSSADLSLDDDLRGLKDNTLYEIKQLGNGGIVVKYTAAKTNEEKADGSGKVIFELTVKWNKYERYMQQMLKGSFSRMFYIISPDCRRYVSLNSMPDGNAKKKNVVALGMRLAQIIDQIPPGLSNKSVDDFYFRLFKSEVKVPKNMKGSKFFVIIAADRDDAWAVSESMLHSIPPIVVVLAIIWLFVCLIASRLYNKTREHLEISNIISESTPLAIIIFSEKKGKIMKINLSATTLLRIEQESISSINIWNIFIEDSDRNYIANAISSNINVLNYEVLVQSFGGGSFWSVCSASPIEIDREKYIVLAVLDINRRKEIEKKLANNASLLEKQVIERTIDLESKAKELEDSNAQLAKAKKNADEANNAKSKFLANMSNELKTPINAIIGYSEILEEEALDRKDTVSADDLHKIISSAKHLLSLIDEILNLSTIEAGKTQLLFEKINIVGMIKDIEGVTMPLVTKNSNSLVLECSKDIGTMYSDSTKLRQCLLNLLSNAAKFTELGKVTLRVSPIVVDGDDFIEFSVMDTGIGIEPGHIEKIFAPFQENKSKNAGAGLGLSLTKKYAEYLGGNVGVESNVGGGSKFTMRLPRICKTVSNEFIDVRNQGEEVLEEIAEDLAAIIENSIGNSAPGVSGRATSFTRKSDRHP